VGERARYQGGGHGIKSHSPVRAQKLKRRSFSHYGAQKIGGGGAIVKERVKKLESLVSNCLVWKLVCLAEAGAVRSRNI